MAAVLLPCLAPSPRSMSQEACGRLRRGRKPPSHLIIPSCVSCFRNIASDEGADDFRVLTCPSATVTSKEARARLRQGRSHPSIAPLLCLVLLGPVGLLARDEGDDGDELAKHIRRQEEHGGEEGVWEAGFLQAHVAECLCACNHSTRRLGDGRDGKEV